MIGARRIPRGGADTAVVLRNEARIVASLLRFVSPQFTPAVPSIPFVPSVPSTPSVPLDPSMPSVPFIPSIPLVPSAPQRDMAWLAEATLVVAEVTIPSLGVGYEIGRAESFGIPVLCLYRGENERRLSAMISGNHLLKVRKYTSVEEALDHIERFMGTDSTPSPDAA